MQLYISGNFQVVRNHWSNKTSATYLKDFTDLDFFFLFFLFFIFIYLFTYLFIYLFIFHFFHFLWQMLFNFPVTQSVCCTLSSQPFRCLRDTLFLRFDGLSDHLYLFKNHRRTFLWPGVRDLTSKLLKCDLIQTLNTFRNPSLRSFVAGNASLVWISIRFNNLLQQI